MNQKINFEVDKMELLEAINKTQFTKVRIHAFASGTNSHKMPVSEEILKARADTIYDKPLVFYDTGRDCGGHSPLEIPCGFVHRQNNELKFERHEDGRLFLVIDALIWNKYSGAILSYFERDNDTKPVSVEIQVIETKDLPNGDVEIVDYFYAAITILGSKISPAIKNAKAELIEFSKVKSGYEKQFAEGSMVTSIDIEIDNSKENIIKTNWINPSSKLYKPIVKAFNKDLLIDEAYLVREQNWEENLSSKLKYPHHIIRNGKLVLHVKGLEFALFRARQQGLTGEPINHLKRHFADLGLHSVDDCMQFGLSQEDVNYLFADDITEFESKLPNEEIINKYKEIHNIPQNHGVNIYEVNKWAKEFYLNNQTEIGSNKQNNLDNSNNFTKKEVQEKMNFEKSKELFAKLVECCGGQKFTKDESEVNKFSIVDYCSTYMYAIDNETKKMSAIPYSYSDDSVSADFANIKPAFMKCEASETEVDMSVMMELAKVVCQAMGMFSSDANQEPAAQVARIKDEGEGDTETIEKDKDKENMSDTQDANMAEDKSDNKSDESKEDSKEESTETKDDEKKEDSKEDKEKVDMSAELVDLQAKFTALEQECNELKEFKSNILEQEKVNKVEFALSEVSKTMSKDQIESWRNKVAEFATVDAWCNALKADAYNYLANKTDVKREGINRMGLPTPTVETKKGLWD